MRFLEGGTLAQRIRETSATIDCDLATGLGADRRPGDGLCARHGRGAPRSEAGQLDVRRRRQAVRHRLWAGALHRRPRGNAAHTRRRSARLAGLHVARAGARNFRLARARMRHLCPGGDSLRAADRPACRSGATAATWKTRSSEASRNVPRGCEPRFLASSSKSV